MKTTGNNRSSYTHKANYTGPIICKRMEDATLVPVDKKFPVAAAIAVPSFSKFVYGISEN